MDELGAIDSGYEGQTDYNTNITAGQSIATAIHQLHEYRKKPNPLVWESLYSLNINADIKDAVKDCLTCLEVQQIQPKNKIILHEIPGSHGKLIGATLFVLNKGNFL